jgi:hypothetical protein
VIRPVLILLWTTWLAAAVLAAEKKAEAPPLQHPMMGVANGCFVETVAFLDHWKQARGSESWARLLQWGAREEEEVVMGHAVAVCEWRGALWSWDINFGWAKLPTAAEHKDRAELVAPPVVGKYPRVTWRYPTYRFDFPQTAGNTPPVAQPGNPNHSIRDASIVGAQLARTRPVNVVVFDRVEKSGEKKQSAAVVFRFHGRYCIYVPEMGTVPFRLQGGTENLRLIQDCVRRAFPGASNFKKL